MDVLMAYTTTEGHTRKVSEFIAELARKKKCRVDLVDLSSTSGNTDIDSYDKIIVAASVHEKRHQPDAGGFLIANRDALNEKPTLFISVSLAAAFCDRIEEAQGYADDFLNYLEWSPNQTLLVAGAIKHDEYDFFKSQIIKHVVLKERPQNSDKGDHEFTDWPTLSIKVEDFIDT